MRYALIFSILAIGVILLGAVLTYPSYTQKLTDEGNALIIEEREKGQFIYETKCATKCHQKLKFASLANSSKYLIAKDKVVYPTTNYTTDYWYNLLEGKISSNCKGVKDLDSRSIELLYAYLSSVSAENDASSDIAINEFNSDVKAGLEIIKTNDGAVIFSNTCQNCHSENLTRAFTDIEWRYQFENYLKIHEKVENAKLPTDKDLQALKAYINKMSSASETDAAVVRNLLRKLRSTDQSTIEDNASDNTSIIPDELTWNDLDWQYEYDKGLEGLIKKFPDKPIIMELTNKYS